VTITEPAAPDLTEVKQRQQQMWASGDFHAVATLIQPVADALCEAVDLQAGWRVLDVATGSGNAAIAAARCGCDVVGIDYVPALLARGRRRVEAEGLAVELHEGDAEAIPFPDASFDAVLSVFGSMFAPNHARAADELARVCRPGGKIGLATWTPDGFIGQMLKVVGAHVPPPAGVTSPVLWGSEPYLRELFGDQVETAAYREQTFTWRFRSAEAFVDYFRAYYGPTLKAFGALPPIGQAALARDLLALVDQFNRSGDGTMVVPSEYLQVVVTRK
jgi:ubiquinone/menaquinone biosynthesis C-methylase UbiE